MSQETMTLQQALDRNTLRLSREDWEPYQHLELFWQDRGRRHLAPYATMRGEYGERSVVTHYLPQDGWVEWGVPKNISIRARRFGWTSWR